MRNPFNHPAWIDISLLLARLALGVYMLAAGWTKLRGGIPEFVHGSFVRLKPAWLPDAIAYPYGYALPVLELLTGLLLITGLFTRIAAGVLTIVLISIAVASVNAVGDASGGGSGIIHHSIIYATLSFLIMIIGSGRLALDPLYFGGGGPQK